MPLSFRHRVFLGLVALGTLPLTVALALLAMQMRSVAAPTLDPIALTGRRLIAAIDTTSLAPAARDALRTHTEAIARQTRLARRAEQLTRWAAGLAVIAVVIGALGLVAGSVILARRWSRYVSAPVEELVQWVRHIEQRQPLPARPVHAGTPEFAALGGALHELSDALDRARRQELEQERLTAFRETARRVAHEMRGPLTALRLALRQMGKDTAPAEAVAQARAVLEEETQRLEAMAREFAEYGRLPEGPEAAVDLRELLEGVVTATVPEGYLVERSMTEHLVVRGHFEPLRRAFQNLVRNAVEAGGPARIHVSADRSGDRDRQVVRVAIRDHGAGIAEELRERVFDPYFTSKASGTGLGLAMVRQTIVSHGGSVYVEDAPGGGARLVVILPESP